MTLPDRLITEPETRTRASNELTEPRVLHTISSILAITPGTSFEELERDGVTLTGAQLRALCERIADESAAGVRAEHTEALGEADERWRERLDLAVEAMRLYPSDHRGGRAPLGRIADALNLGGHGKTNLRVTLEGRLGVKPDLAAEAVDAAIEAILARLAKPRPEVKSAPLSHGDAVRGMQP